MSSGLGVQLFAGQPENYQVLLAKLAKYFEYNCRRCNSDPWTMADDTIDRVAVVLNGKKASPTDINKLARNVAKKVLLENSRKPRWIEFIEDILPGDPLPARFDQECLEISIERLEDTDRTLIDEYYWAGAETAAALHTQRLLQAQRLGVSYSALRQQAHRVIRRVRENYESCMERKAT